MLAEHFGKLAVIWIACFLRCLFAGGTGAHQSHRLVETKVEQIVCEAFAYFSLEACSEVRGGYMGGECDVAKLYLFHIMLVNVAPYGVDEAHFAACSAKDATDGIFLIACSLVFERLNRREDLFLHGDAIEGRAADVALARSLVVEVLHVHQRVRRPRVDETENVRRAILAEGKDCFGSVARFAD